MVLFKRRTFVKIISTILVSNLFNLKWPTIADDILEEESDEIIEIDGLITTRSIQRFRENKIA